MSGKFFEKNYVKKNRNMSLKIVILDGIYACGTDLSWNGLNPLGEVISYDRTTPDEVLKRSKDAEILIVNKIQLGAAELEKLPLLRLIIISATGMDNVDLKAAAKHQISVKNVAGYSTQSVAQHTFALILELSNKVNRHSDAVKNGEWNPQTGFSFTKATIPELSGKALGVYGFGKIGQEVAKIGRAFGMKIFVVSAHADGEDFPFYQFVDLPALFEKCDVISLHAPLKEDNQAIINASMFQLMKPDALLINTARGGLINEEDLINAFEHKKIGGAGLDVFSSEPPPTNHALFRFNNCIITPHIAWTSSTSRRKLIDGVVLHVERYCNREKQHGRSL